MKKFVEPSTIDGRVAPPPSKSMMLRAAAAACLASGRSRILNPSFCDDALAALEIVETLGAEVRVEGRGRTGPNQVDVPWKAFSAALRVGTDVFSSTAPAFGTDAVTITGGNLSGARDLFCGESGFCLRMFTPIAALRPVEGTLHGLESLAARPIGPIEEPLRRLGAECFTRNGFPPVHVRGPLRGGQCLVDASLSSQFLSGLLFALPLAEKSSTVRVSALSSKPYIDMTRSVLKDFGIGIAADGGREFRIDSPQEFRPCEYRVEGDWSGAAFLLVAGAVAGRVRVAGLNLDSPQADRRILAVLDDCGAGPLFVEDEVIVERRTLKAFHFDAADCPDLIPPLTALACFCEGTSRIGGVHRLRAKESDRAAALIGEFSAVGADIGLDGDLLVVRGRRPAGGAANARRDHRIAMALAVAGLASEDGISVTGCEFVSKSYPKFFRDLVRLGANIHE